MKKLVLIDINIQDDSDTYAEAETHLTSLIEANPPKIVSLETLHIGGWNESNKDYEIDILKLLVANNAVKIKNLLLNNIYLLEMIKP